MCVIFVKVIFVIFKNKNTFHLYKEYIYIYIFFIELFFIFKIENDLKSATIIQYTIKGRFMNR